MLYLILSVVCASGLVLLFKWFSVKGIPIFQAIVFNYWAATASAALLLPESSFLTTGAILKAPWLLYAVGLGCLFIVVFNLTSITTVQMGVSTASVSSKLGLVFPVTLAFLLYGEGYTPLKLIGILLALVAVVLSSVQPPRTVGNLNQGHWWLPLLVFAGSGACDSLTQYATKTYLVQGGLENFTLALFTGAAIAGTARLAYLQFTGGTRVAGSTIAWGIVLGVINYFSFLFILKALATLPWGSSVVFPLNNLGTVAFATVAGMLVFNERPNKLNMLGLGFAAASIITIVIANT